MTGTLYQQFLQSMDWLKGKLDVRYDIEGAGAQQRKEIWEIPETVFKEAIINALWHIEIIMKRGQELPLNFFRIELKYLILVVW